MKGIYLLAFVIGLVLTSCSPGTSDSELAALKDRITQLENSKSVVGIKFQDTKMILTYSTSETATLDMPSGLNGLNGTNGAEGTGIKTITYNETTGILTITLTNGNSSEFKVISNGGSGMTAVLISDVNGKMFVSEVTLGAVPVATISYDANFNITSMLSKIVKDGRIMDEFKIAKEYTAGKLSNVQTIKYATNKEIKYSEEYFYPLDTILTSNVGDFYKPNSNDTTYRYYSYEYYDLEGYHYYIHPYVVKHNYFSSWSYFVKVNDNVVYYFSELKESPANTYWYELYEKYTKTGTINIGDIESTENLKIENNTNGNPEKIYYEDNRYIQLYYNSGALLIKAEEYYNNGAGWIKNDNYLTYEYNSNNLLTSGKMNYSAKAPEEVFKTVYDSVGNPVEIYYWEGELDGYYGYFDPFTNPDDPWAVSHEAPGLQLVAKIEYDYGYKNFFGNSLSAIIPELKNYRIFNAPIKLSHAQSWGYASMEDDNFNSTGYPVSLLLNVYDGDSQGYSLEFNIDYIKKE